MILELNVVDAKKLILQNESRKDFVILDVRTPSEFEEEHIPMAVNIDFYQDDFVERIRKLDRKKMYLVHCHSGRRSAQATKIMDKLGFMRVWNVRGLLFGR